MLFSSDLFFYFHFNFFNFFIFYCNQFNLSVYFAKNRPFFCMDHSYGRQDYCIKNFIQSFKNLLFFNIFFSPVFACLRVIMTGDDAAAGKLQNLFNILHMLWGKVHYNITAKKKVSPWIYQNNIQYFCEVSNTDLVLDVVYRLHCKYLFVSLKFSSITVINVFGI
jgi:hypothetical protein